MRLSEPTKRILDEFRSNRGNALLSEEDALAMYLGASAKVADLSDEELIQVALISFHQWFGDARKELADLKISLVTKNRAQRRHR